MAAGLVAAVVLLAGCGSGSGGHPPASKTPDEAAPLLAVSRCMRAHGYPSFPDPTQDPQTGQWAWPDSVPQRLSSTACDSLLRQAKAALGGKRDAQKVPAADMVKLREYARCMRQHGVSDWPDPNEKGKFPLPPRLSGPNSRNLVLAQDHACAQYRPGGGIGSNQPGSGGN